MMEEYGYVLDFMPYGKPDDVRREPVSYIIGERFFTLLEAVVKPNEKVNGGERVYLGREQSLRNKIDRIKDRVDYNALTGSAKAELPNVLALIIRSREKDFVDFINKCGPITLRQHQLELIPGIGKKHLTEILAEREKAKFESLDDITKRIPHMPHPINIIVERIILELKGGERYFLFTRPPQLEGEREHRPSRPSRYR